MNTKRIILFSASVVFLAGCSLTGGGNDGGIFRSDDGGKTFSQKAAAVQNKNIGGVDVLSIAVDPSSSQNIYIGTQSAGILKSENGGDLWKPLNISQSTPTKVYSIAIDPNNPQKIYATTVISGRGKIMKTEDGGSTWKEIYSEPTDSSLILTLAVKKQNSAQIFAGTDKGQIIYSEDEGQSWRSLYRNDNGKAIYKIALDSQNSDVAYFLLFQSGVLRTTDGGQTFQELSRNANSGLLSSVNNGFDQAVSLAADPSVADEIYVGDAEGLLRSRDRGETWQAVKTLNDPTNASIRSIAVNPANSDEIIFVAAKAFYKSNDGGVNWMPVEFNTSRSPEVAAYNPSNPAQIFVGMNSR